MLQRLLRVGLALPAIPLLYCACRMSSSEKIQQEDLETAYDAFKAVVDVQDRRYRLRAYPKTFIGEDAVKALVKEGLAPNAEEAVDLGNKLLSAGYFNHVTRDHGFANEYLFYRFAKDENKLIEIGPGFWNIRGSFKIKKIVDIGTHMSVIALPNGKFLVIDAVELTPEIKAEFDLLTNGGAKIEAVVATHPFHTLAFPKFYQAYPKVPYYGTPRHVRNLKDIPWLGDVTQEEVQKKWAPHVEFRIPAGAEFVAPLPESHNHFSCCFVFHRESRTLHVDDTLMFGTNPGVMLRLAGMKKGHLGFHPTLTTVGINPDPSAPNQFKAWMQQMITDWDVDNLCVAHLDYKIGGVKKAIADLLADSEVVFAKMTAQRAKAAIAKGGQNDQKLKQELGAAEETLKKNGVDPATVEAAAPQEIDPIRSDDCVDCG